MVDLALKADSEANMAAGDPFAAPQLQENLLGLEVCFRKVLAGVEKLLTPLT